MNITMHPPSKESSLIKQIGHDGLETLAIEFQNGDLWHYSPVPQIEFSLMQQAASAGKYFHAHIKGKYQAVKQ
jgi:hypothetical protein